MPEKNKTKYAILGVLSLKPGSGYDIKKFCDKTIAHYWNENFGNIYPVLNQLEQDGLIEPDCPDDSERKKCYRITDAGRAEFRQWLMLPVEFRPARSELLLKLSFGSQIPREKALEMIQTVRKKYAGDLKLYKMLEASYINDEEAKMHPEYPYCLAPLRYGIEITAASIRWCDETMESIKNHLAEV